MSSEDIERIRRIANDAQHLPTMTLDEISEMTRRSQDLEFQYGLCLTMMDKGEILPYPFERAAILLRKYKRYEEEISLCRYVENWCRRCEAEYTEDKGAMIWRSPRLQRVISRQTKAQAFIKQLEGLNAKSDTAVT